MLIGKLVKYYVVYQKRRIEVPHNPRSGKCSVCGRSVSKGEIKVTQLHHFHYKYSYKTVKENPILALENTIEACYSCHKNLDWLRNATTYVKDFSSIIKVVEKLPPFLQDRFTKICKLWLKEKKKK